MFISKLIQTINQCEFVIMIMFPRIIIVVMMIKIKGLVHEGYKPTF